MKRSNKKNSKKVVMVFGAFDILHKGHLNYFDQARKYGDYLIAIIARDKTILEFKGEEPINNEKVRQKNVGKYVDKAILGHRTDRHLVIRKNKPDHICLGYDQMSFDKGLKKFKIPITRLKAYKPHIYKSSKLRGTIVKRSKIHGEGVFANRNFKKGERIIKWDTSHKLTKQEVDSLTKKEKRYVTYFKGKYTLMFGPGRYVNHSCEANTTVKNFSDVAKRKIKKGEEITSDYSEARIPGKTMVCKCKSKKCRGIIKN